MTARSGSNEVSSTFSLAFNALSVMPGMAGIGSFARSSIDALLATDEDFRLLVVSGPSPLDIDDPRVQQVSVEVTDPRWEHLYLPGLLEEYAVDVYHTPVPLAPLVAPCPVLVTIHDAIPFVAPAWCDPRFHAWIEQTIEATIRSGDHVLTVSEHARSDLVAALGLGQDQITSIYQSVSEGFGPQPEADLAAVRRRLGLPEPYLLFVGAREPRKNLDVLVRGFASYVQAHGNETQLLVVGPEGHPRTDVEKLAREAGIPERVRVLGYIETSDLHALYAGARCVCVPSHYEGFGRPVLEAMASGTPVIASTKGALPEVAGGAALLCDPDDASAWRHALEQVLGDPSLQKRLCKRGIKRAKAFRPLEHGTRLLTLYRRLVSSSAAANTEPA